MKDSGKDTIGIVLLNLGGPESLADVEPFLFNLFSDRQLIRLGPKLLQKPMARLIARKRAPKSREAYRLIGGGSPLAAITAGQGQALAELLTAAGLSCRVVVAMRYWPPFAAAALKQLQLSGISRIIALPLYPHYSIATSGSSLSDLRSAATAFANGFEIAEIRSWPEQPRYINCLAAGVRSGLQQFHNQDVQLVYSAHSLPVKFIKEGDPYPDQLAATINALERQTGVRGRLCFQSRSGPVQWLSPSTPEMMGLLAGEGCRNILMLPISFVSDHVETLYEIDIQYRELARTLDMRLERTPSLNVQPGFIDALKELVIEAAGHKGW